MSVVYHSPIQSVPAGSASPAVRMLARPFLALANGVRIMRERARAMSELTRMSDAELADIGLTRADLPNLFDRH
jgi:uncharacterized protein YjiS (DUF1127 family)